MSLVTVLDQLRQTQSKNDLLPRFVPLLTSTDWLIVAGWDTAATIGPNSGLLDLTVDQATVRVSDHGRKTLFVGSLCTVESLTTESPVIRYENSSYCVLTSELSPSVPRLQETHDPETLLVALSLMRDSLDATLLLPSELRQARIDRFSAAATMSSDRFSRLAAWYSQIHRYATGEDVLS